MKDLGLETQYFDEIRTPAATLPEGWTWVDYNDGSGHLESPDKSFEISFDRDVRYLGEPAIDYRSNALEPYKPFFGTFSEFKEWAEGIAQQHIREYRQREKISVLLIEPGQYPKTVEIDRDLESMQQLVGGNIEAIYPFDLPIALICNEEGKLQGLPLNRALYGEDGKPYDVISGNFFLAYADPEEEHFSSLPEELIEKYADQFKYPERFYRGREGVIAKRYMPDTGIITPQNERDIVR